MVTTSRILPKNFYVADRALRSWMSEFEDLKQQWGSSPSLPKSDGCVFCACGLTCIAAHDCPFAQKKTATVTGDHGDFVDEIKDDDTGSSSDEASVVEDTDDKGSTVSSTVSSAVSNAVSNAVSSAVGNTAQVSRYGTLSLLLAALKTHKKKMDIDAFATRLLGVRARNRELRDRVGVVWQVKIGPLDAPRAFAYYNSALFHLLKNDPHALLYFQRKMEEEEREH